MIKSVKYTQGNEMTLYVPLILLGNEGRQTIDIDLITDANVSISRNGVKTAITPVFVDGYMTLNLAATLAAGAYAIEYSFKYDGRKVAGRKDGSLAIVADDAQSNWSGMISNGTATLDEVFIAGNVMTDAEFEALKEEYRLKTAAAEAARIAYVAAKAAADAVAYTAVEGLSEEALTEIITNAVNEAMSQASVSVDLTPVTSRLDNTTYGLNALKTAIDGIEVDVPADVARETTPKAIENAALAAKTAAEAIVIPTDYAKASDIPTDYAKASELGQLRQECDTIDTKATQILAATYKGNYPIVEVSQAASVVLQSNAYTTFATAISQSVSLSCQSRTDGIVGECVAQFTMAEGGQISDSFVWDVTPDFTAGKTYIISVINNRARYAEFAE